MVNELFAFLISVANPVGGVVAPIELRVILAVFAHVLGVITQAGIFSVFGTKIKFVMSLYPDPEQLMEVGWHWTNTLNEAVVGWITEATEVSVNVNLNVQVSPTVATLLDSIVKLKELSMFLVNVAKVDKGVVVPVDVKVPTEVFAQKFGLIKQAWIVYVVV